MAGNKQLDRLVGVIKNLEKGLESSIVTLQKNISALVLGLGGPKPPKKELIKALERLRLGLNRALLLLEKKIAGKPQPRRRKSAAKRKSPA
jgi:hypothetical protein